MKRPRDREDGFNEVARDYVRLALAVGRHDDRYVDAYYGPPEWRARAEEGAPAPAAALQDRCRDLIRRARATPASDRRAFLEAQLVAVGAFLEGLAGARRPLPEEARLLYDLEPPVRTEAEFEAAGARLASLLPGAGDLASRVQAFRDRYAIPPDRVAAVVDAALDETRRRTRELVALSGGESFQVAYVRERPWGAYNWYQGGFSSRIEVNLDLPAEIGPTLRTIAHEGYPGHHTHAVLIEDRLVRGEGWPEHQIHPLFTPQSLISEGAANVGVSVIFAPGEEWAFLEAVLAPRAGLTGLDFGAYRAVLDALEPLSYVRGEAARRLLDGGAAESDVVAFLMRCGLMGEPRARKAVEFIRAYRSYVFNYTGGRDLVRDHVGDGPGRAGRFFDLLQRPATPGGLLPLRA